MGNAKKEISPLLCHWAKRNGNLFAQQSLHAAIRTDWPWLKPNTSAPPSPPSPSPSPCLPNKTKCSYWAERRRQILALWWICWPRPGLAFSPGWFNYNIEALCIATGVVWKFKSSYIICLRRSPHIGDGTRKQTHTRGHTHCVMYDSSGCVIRHQVNSRAVTNRQRKERVTYLWGRSNTTAALYINAALYISCSVLLKHSLLVFSSINNTVLSKCQVD